MDGEVTVQIKNPPVGATKWQISVIDWDVTEIQSWGTKEQDNIGESAIFDIPAEWSFPLRIIVAIYQKINGSQELYRVQSYKPYLWDWDLNDWGTEPDPTYKAIFIPGPGSYDYNVATEQFELIEAAFLGTITDIDLTYDLNAPSEEWVRVSMPSSIPLDVRGVPYIVGRNDMSTAQEMGVRWIIRDPSGIIVSEGTQWAGFKMSAGGSVSFGIDEITFTKLGTWELEAELLMNPTAPVIVDTYTGDLCTVFEGVAPPEAQVLLVPLALIAGVGILAIGTLALAAPRRGASESGGSNPGLVGPIVAATVAMQKLKEERRREKAKGW